MMRWWWFGPSVTRPELERELRAMADAGIGGVEVAYVYPLPPATIEFGSQGFLADLRFAAERAHELGLRSISRLAAAVGKVITAGGSVIMVDSTVPGLGSAVPGRGDRRAARRYQRCRDHCVQHRGERPGCGRVHHLASRGERGPLRASISHAGPGPGDGYDAIRAPADTRFYCESLALLDRGHQQLGTRLQSNQRMILRGRTGPVLPRISIRGRRTTA
jgi:hypothetical protein